MKLKLGDVVLFLLVLAAVIAVSFYAYAAPNSETFVHVKSAEGEWFYPLDTDRTFTVEGPLGKTEIAIKDGKAFVVDSDCPEKLCVRQGKVSQAGQWIACLPNHVMISIESRSQNDIDAVSF
ncbi:MAG: NusG domain II-containing protein [Spirochaetales bacterium]|nr:NusG domain II-containing protein [Spirochaetales bacterium]